MSNDRAKKLEREVSMEHVPIKLREQAAEWMRCESVPSTAILIPPDDEMEEAYSLPWILAAYGAYVVAQARVSQSEELLRIRKAAEDANSALEVFCRLERMMAPLCIADAAPVAQFIPGSWPTMADLQKAKFAQANLRSALERP
jgi:hypothetical protein